MKTIKTISLALISILLFATAGCGGEDSEEELCNDMYNFYVEYVSKCRDDPNNFQSLNKTEKKGFTIKNLVNVF